ncbi:MAG: coat protein F [Gracilibacter sp. BRH_c7a]|nr:MAG: coat protein F [Gracilibacter sp. BRH_c7a]
MQLSQKERMLLEDLKSHEEMCIKKYTNYANQAQDSQLKQMFQNHAQIEQEHYNTIDQILKGQVPNIQQQGQQQQQQFQGQQAGMSQQKDADSCQDMLQTEKYVSGAYDTAIFEFQDPNVRQVLNHIQSEEQKHGEAIFSYMQSKGLYKVH